MILGILACANTAWAAWPKAMMSGLDETSPVKSFPANAFGVYDMHGNIFEWVEDCYEADFANAPRDGSANKNGNCANRVFRSGTYLSNPYMQRSARRGAPYPATQRGRNYLGFRVTKSLVE